MRLTVKPNTNPEWPLHRFNAFARGQFVAYADTFKAARWALKEYRRMVWKMRIERVIERYL